MVNERVQRRIDGLLDEAEAAIQAEEWQRAVELSQRVLAIDAQNEDAVGLWGCGAPKLHPNLKKRAGSNNGAPQPFSTRLMTSCSR